MSSYSDFDYLNSDSPGWFSRVHQLTLVCILHIRWILPVYQRRRGGQRPLSAKFNINILYQAQNILEKIYIYFNRSQNGILPINNSQKSRAWIYPWSATINKPYRYVISYFIDSFNHRILCITKIMRYGSKASLAAL